MPPKAKITKEMILNTVLEITREAGFESVNPIKTLILDQTVIAGLGNIYADECLALAGILPSRFPVW